METFFIDTPEMNWKNSEVMTAFLDIYQEPVKEGSLEEGLPFDVSQEIDLNDGFDPERFMAEQKALGEIQEVVERLNKLAADAGLAGDGMTAYKIERAVEEVKKLGLEIWNPNA